MNALNKYSKAYVYVYGLIESHLDTNEDPDVSIYSIWTQYFANGKRDIEGLVERTKITSTQAETFLKFEPPLDYDRSTQQQALLLFKTLLVFNALLKEFKVTKEQDLAKHLKTLIDAIAQFDRKSDAFDSLKGMMLNASTRQLSRKIRTRLKLVRGILNTKQEMFVASRTVLLFAQEAKSTDILEVRGQLHSNLRSDFADLIKAQDTMMALASITLRVTSGKGIRTLKNALDGVIKAYSTPTKIASEISEQSSLLAELEDIKNERGISEQEKIQKQQEAIAQSGLDDDVKTFIEVMSNADVLVNHENKTEIGRQLGLTKDQEDAMTSEGLTLISAGAGSGKTRVLSGKVVNLVDDPNVTPYNIMAVSFSKKSAQDLAEKVKQAAGSKIPQMSHTAIGRTTHSVALEIVNRFDSEAGNRDLVSNEYELKTLIDEAIKLVRETVSLGKDPKAENIFKNRPETIKGTQKRNDLSVLGLLISVEKYREYKNQLVDGESPIADTLKAIRTKILNEDDLSTSEINLVREALNTDRGEKVLNRAFGGDVKKINRYTFNKAIKTSSLASAPQWWGHKADSQEQEEVKVSAKECQLFITKCKANMVSPTEAYNKAVKAKSSESFLFKSKVYAAYEYLKDDRSLMDFDDMLIRAVQVLSLGANLRQVKSQYKHIIVDEAQDLNPVQHAFFGLISGTMEPGNIRGTKPPIPAKEIKNDPKTSYTLIGDENQSIYGFRGATSQEFSSRAETFEVKTLGINFRSKKGIVEAANKLISTEEGSLGMTCTAIYQGVDTGEEAISQDSDHESSLSAASSFADRVAQGTNTEFETYRYEDYGVACRTNAELIPYTLALLEKDIPFVSPVNPFDHPTTKKIVRALSIVGFDYDRYQKDQVGSFYGALLNFHKDMKMGLPKGVNDIFKKHLHNRLDGEGLLKQLEARTNLDYVMFDEDDLDGDLSEVNKVLFGANSDMEMENFSDAEQKKIETYCMIVNNLNAIAEDNPTNLFDMLIGAKPIDGDFYLKSADGQTLKEIIMDSAKNSSGEMEQALSSISDDEQIKELKTVDFAIAPLNALRNIFIKGITEKKSVSDILQNIADMSTASLAAKNNSKELTDDRVILDTVHGWKGLEVTHLTVPMVQGKFPYDREEEFDPIIYKDQQEFDIQKAEQERKLAYVAITRGKKSVTVQSYTNTNSGKPTGASEFISTLFSDCGEAPIAKEAKLNVARQILAETAVVLGDDMTETEIDLAIKMFS